MKTIKNYIFWAYERGSLHYDVMVTLILLFVFVSPRFMDFKDKPKPLFPPRANEVLVKTAGQSRFIYEIPVEDLGGATTDTDLRTAMQRVILKVSSDATLESYKPVPDRTGKVIAYDATVSR